jgi:hypothetical protein
MVPSFFMSAHGPLVHIAVAKLTAKSGASAEILFFISRPFLPICLLIIKSNSNSLYFGRLRVPT